jgi:hypothetical protein
MLLYIVAYLLLYFYYMTWNKIGTQVTKQWNHAGAAADVAAVISS